MRIGLADDAGGGGMVLTPMSSSSFSGVSVSQKGSETFIADGLPGELFRLDLVAGLEGGPAVADQCRQASTSLPGAGRPCPAL